jgi:hypothetical protein
MTRRLLIPAALLLAYCATATGGIAVVRRAAAPPSLTARTGSATTPLEGEVVRFSVPLKGGGTRPADVFIARDPQNGLTFRRILVVGERPFEEAQQLMDRFLASWRIAEHGGRIYGFGGDAIVLIDDFGDSHPSLAEAERETMRWLAQHPEMMDMNSINMRRYVEYARRVGVSGFFVDLTTSEGKPTILRDVLREGDHWLVTIEGPSHQIATLVINDRDELVDVKVRTP